MGRLRRSEIEGEAGKEERGRAGNTVPVLRHRNLLLGAGCSPQNAEATGLL